MIQRILLLAASIGILLHGRTAVAQESRQSTAFSTIELRAGGAYNVNRDVFHDFWQPGYGLEAAVATPFYLGMAEAGAALHRYEALHAGPPAFNAFLPYVGWGLQLDPAAFLSWYAGVRVGVYRMMFDDEEAFRAERIEHEFAMGFNTRLDLHVPQGIGLFVDVRFMQAYTYVRFRTVYVSAGLSYRLSSPEWLRTLLY
jgi:hypothetical protein